MAYLKQKPGSIEDVVYKHQAKYKQEGYKKKFAEALKNTMGGIGSMTPKEKIAFFNKVEEEWKPSTGKHADEQLMKDFIDKGGKVEKIPENKRAYNGNRIKPHLANDKNLARQEAMSEETVSEAMPGGANSSSRRGTASSGVRKKYRFGYRVSEKEPKGKDIEEELPRQLKDPKKETMVSKHGKTIVIDKTKEKEYLAKGWKLAEGYDTDTPFAISGVESQRPTEDMQETIDAGEVSKMADKKKEVKFSTANVSTTETIDAGEVSKMADKKKEVKFSTANVSTTEDKKEPKKDVIGSDKPEPSVNLENTIRNIWNKAANETATRGDSVLLPTRNESKIPPIAKDNKPGVKIAKIRATRDSKDSKDGPSAKDPAAQEKQILTLQGQVNILKAKLENEKNKVIKPVADKETGEVPLTVGLAQKLLRDKAEKKEDKEDKDEVKKEAVSPYKLKYETLRARLKEKAEKAKLAKKKDEPTKGRTMTGNPASKIETDPEISYTN